MSQIPEKIVTSMAHFGYKIVSKVFSESKVTSTCITSTEIGLGRINTGNYGTSDSLVCLSPMFLACKGIGYVSILFNFSKICLKKFNCQHKKHMFLACKVLG